MSELDCKDGNETRRDAGTCRTDVVAEVTQKIVVEGIDDI